MAAATKGTRMNTKALAAVACLWLPVVASAADDQSVTSQLDSLGQKFEKILSTQGISMGGQVTGDFGLSDLSGNSEVPTRRSDETIGFTQVDFDLRARPNTVTQARAIFRLYLDDASFFGAPYTPFETRWLSIDGSAQQGILYYHLANLAEKWSPLSIWSPDPSFTYTPRLFAQEQQEAMSERFQGNNVRNLQGFNIGLRAAVPNARIDSFDVQVLAAKLLTAAGLGTDPVSALTSGINWSMDGTTGAPDSLANFDRWALGARGSVTFLGAFNLGVNYLNIKDLKSTYGIQDTSLISQDRDSFAVDGNIATIQGGADIAKFMGSQNLVLGLDAELGYSSWNYNVGRDTSSLLTTYVPLYKATTGSAIDVDLKAGWKTENWSAAANVGYLSVDSGYRSDLAQSLTFNQKFGRIYNTDQDVYSNATGAYTNLLHYNTFDALYDHVFRYVAENQNEYAKDPYDKLAYTNYVGPALNPSLGQWTSNTALAAAAYRTAAAGTDTTATKAAKLALYQQALLNSPFDRDFQLVLPSGEASPNRVGPKFGFEGSFLNGGVEGLLSGYLLQEAKGSVLDDTNQAVAEKAKFQQIDAGVKVRIDRFLPNWNTLLHPRNPIPLELSLSAGQSTAKGGTSLDYTSTEVAASAYVGILPRLSLLGGYQEIIGLDNSAAEVSRNVSDMAGGLEFKIQEGAYFLAMYSLLKTEYPNASEYNFDQSIWSTKISVSF
jgi:hypothetical protein